MTGSNAGVGGLIREPQHEFNATLDALHDLPRDNLQQACGHRCARRGSARDLRLHNIFP